MSIRSGFFNSIDGDRRYNAGRFAEYFATFIGNGVFPNPSTNLQVISNNDMTVTVRAGKAWINGYILINDNDYILNIDVADGLLNRIDRIVVRYDTVDREMKLEVKRGDYATNAVAKGLQRDADAYELGLADIIVKNGIISITQANISDLRLNDDLCGIVHGIVEQVDTTTLFNQYLTWLDEKKDQYDNDMMQWTTNKKDEFNIWTTIQEQDFESWRRQEKANFDAWFASAQNILDENIAANLLIMIGDLPNLTTADKSNLVNAVNEVESIAANKVDQVEGKGLSTENYTTEEKSKLEGIEEGAEVNEVSEEEHKALETKVTSHLAESTTQAHLAKSISLEDTENNFVAQELEGAMNELFTSVSNGKTLVSGAITGVDDSVVIPADPTFNDLVNAIGQIRTGLQTASGSFSSRPGRTFIVSGVAFAPSTVVVWGTSGIAEGSAVSTKHPLSSYRLLKNSLGATSITRNSDGFTIVLSGSATKNYDYYWYAYE